MMREKQVGLILDPKDATINKKELQDKTTSPSKKKKKNPGRKQNRKKVEQCKIKNKQGVTGMDLISK